MRLRISPGWDKKTVFNAGGGVVYDRTIINAVQFIQDQDSYLFQLTNPIALGNPEDPYDSIRTDPRIDKNNGLSNVAGCRTAYSAEGSLFAIQLGGAVLS